MLLSCIEDWIACEDRGDQNTGKETEVLPVETGFGWDSRVAGTGGGEGSPGRPASGRHARACVAVAVCEAAWNETRMK
eukprot:663795-Pleurochrysis_carterae.AAC.1